MDRFRMLCTTIMLLWCQASVYGQQSATRLQMELDSIFYQDQLYRGDSVETRAAKFGWDSPEVSVLWAKQQRLDIANMKKIDSIIKLVGYPGKTLVGEQRKSIAFHVIQHGEFEDQEKYLTLVTAAVNAGELNWSSLALLIDRIRVHKGQQQLYGSQLSETAIGTRIFPIEDEAQVNVRRHKAGLGKLEDYLQTFGIKYILPTRKGNFNPAELYVIKEVAAVSPVELIGGYDALFAKLNYPSTAKNSNITGKVTLQLTIDSNGTPKNIEVVKSLHPACDQEAIRVMKAAKFSNPAKVDHEIRISFPFPFDK